MEYTAHRQRQGTGLATVLGPNAGVATAERFAAREHADKLHRERAQKAAQAAQAAASKKLYKELTDANFDGSLNYQSRLNDLANKQYYDKLSEYYAESGGVMDLNNPKLQQILKDKRRLEQMASDSKEYAKQMQAAINKVGENPEKYTSGYLEKLKANQSKDLEQRFNDGDWDIPKPEFRRAEALKTSSAILKDFDVLEPQNATGIDIKFQEDRVANGGVPGSYEDQARQILEMYSPERQKEIEERATKNGISVLAQAEYERVKATRAPKMDDKGNLTFNNRLDSIAKNGSFDESVSDIEGKDGVTVKANKVTINEDNIRNQLRDLLVDSPHKIASDIINGKYKDQGDKKNIESAIEYYLGQVKSKINKPKGIYQVDRNSSAEARANEKEELDIFRKLIKSESPTDIESAVGSFFGFTLGDSYVSKVMVDDDGLVDSGNMVRLEFSKKPGKEATKIASAYGVRIDEDEENGKFYMSFDQRSASYEEALVTIFHEKRKKGQGVADSERDALLGDIEK